MLPPALPALPLHWPQLVAPAPPKPETSTLARETAPLEATIDTVPPGRRISPPAVTPREPARTRASPAAVAVAPAKVRVPVVSSLRLPCCRKLTAPAVMLTVDWAAIVPPGVLKFRLPIVTAL